MRILGLAVAIGLTAGALAQEPAAPETVTVEAQRQRELIEHEVSTFVSGITRFGRMRTRDRRPPSCTCLPIPAARLNQDLTR